MATRMQIRFKTQGRDRSAIYSDLRAAGASINGHGFSPSDDDLAVTVRVKKAGEFRERFRTTASYPLVVSMPRERNVMKLAAADVGDCDQCGSAAATHYRDRDQKYLCAGCALN